jgi:4-hydroxymandelate oxidase
MPSSAEQGKNRRQFFRYLAASPLLASPSLFGRPLTDFLGFLDEGKTFKPGELINSPEQALDVMEFEAVAQKALPPAHWGYLTTGVDDDATVQANHKGFSKVQIRSRRLVNVEKLDTSVRLFGTTWETPIFLSPVSAMKAFHPDGEAAVAKAARVKNHLQILSTVASCSVEEVTAARGGPVWQQLYPTNDWNVTKAIIRRAEGAGAPVLVLTVDLHEKSNRETLFRSRRYDDRECSNCHEEGFKGYVARKPMFDGLDVSKANALYPASLDWDFVSRLRDSTRMKLMIKGIVTGEDAQLAVGRGVDGIVVSNHGGRAEESLRSTIESLPEVVQGVSGKIPVLLDGGVRRGTDIFKALALGATAVGIGRPYAWGLASFGQPGVEAVLSILRRELQVMMREAGTPSIAAITKSSVAAHF